jgi:hypothetical protein
VLEEDGLDVDQLRNAEIVLFRVSDKYFREGDFKVVASACLCQRLNSRHPLLPACCEWKSTYSNP